jgi:hypothetical protein
MAKHGNQERREFLLPPEINDALDVLHERGYVLSRLAARALKRLLKEPDIVAALEAAKEDEAA